MDSQSGSNPAPQGQTQLGGAIRLVTIAVDSNSVQTLTDFANSTPLVRIQAKLNDYLTDEQDLPSQWTRAAQIDVCVIDFDKDRSQAQSTAEKLHATLPEISIFALSSDAQPDLIIQAMRHGCSEYLLKPLTYDQMLNSIARVAARKRESQTAAQIVVFLGAKGGTGVTMMATHLGAILAKSHGRRTLLVDLHPALGDAELYLGLLKYSYSFADLAENFERLDSDLLQSFLLHHGSGLDLLPAPVSLTARAPRPEAVGATLDFLRYTYDVLLIDCPAGMSDENMQAVERADHLLLIGVPEVAALRNLARYVEHLARVNYPREKIGVVINRWTKRATISDEQIEQAIHTQIFWRLPNQYYEVIRIINEGDPSSRSSELSRSLQGLASHIAGKPSARVEAAKASKGLLAMLGR